MQAGNAADVPTPDAARPILRFETTPKATANGTEVGEGCLTLAPPDSGPVAEEVIRERALQATAGGPEAC